MDESFWRDRLMTADDKGERHKAVFECPMATWNSIEDAHRRILKQFIQPEDSLLDVGCGWGRLLHLLPESWDGIYHGIDISPDFVELAREEHESQYWFFQMDMLEIPENAGLEREYDWAVAISVKHMIIREVSTEAWATREEAILTRAKKILFLEYDVDDPGKIKER